MVRPAGPSDGCSFRRGLPRASTVAISVERTDSRVKFTAPASTVEIKAIKGLDGTPIKIHNLPFSDLVDYAQYKSVENSHKSPKDSFHHSGTNGFTSRLDARG